MDGGGWERVHELEPVLRQLREENARLTAKLAELRDSARRQEAIINDYMTAEDEYEQMVASARAQIAALVNHLHIVIAAPTDEDFLREWHVLRRLVIASPDLAALAAAAQATQAVVEAARVVADLIYLKHLREALAALDAARGTT
jgi:hypothetical protein